MSTKRRVQQFWAALFITFIAFRFLAVHHLALTGPAATTAAAPAPLPPPPLPPPLTLARHTGTLEVVWIAPANEFWEADFFSDLLARTGRNITMRIQEPEEVACATRHADGSFTIVVPRWISLLDRLPQEFHNGSCTYGIIHPSDEGLYESPAPQYGLPGVHFVLRHYALPPRTLPADRVRSIGLGYKLGFWDGFVGPPPAAVTCADRHWIWSFAGTLHHEERRRAMDAFSGLNPHQIDQTSAFNAPDGLSTAAYRNMLLNSLFVLCPLGHVNLDTFRLYEALEAGAIPVTMSTNPMLSGRNFSGHYWPLVFHTPDIPFIVHDSWQDAFAEVQALLAGPIEELERRRHRVLAFWQHHKEETALWVSQKLDAAERA